MTNTCDFFRCISRDTWERIHLARRGGFKIYETTVTQNILYYFYLFRSRYSTYIQLFESTNEKTNGNDLEILLNTSKGYVKLPTQAKIIYSSGNYSALKHRNQIHDLIKYAAKRSVSGIPLYLFYNYSEAMFKFPSTICQVTVQKEDYGCTICDAFKLINNFAMPSLGKDGNGFQNWIIPSFSDLHPKFCLPFWILVCCHDPTKDVDSLKRTLGLGDIKTDVRTYSIDELANEGYWRPLSLDNDENIKGQLAESNEEQSGFNPRFRIIIN